MLPNKEDPYRLVCASLPGFPFSPPLHPVFLNLLRFFCRLFIGTLRTYGCPNWELLWAAYTLCAFCYWLATALFLGHGRAATACFFFSRSYSVSYLCWFPMNATWLKAAHTGDGECPP